MMGIPIDILVRDNIHRLCVDVDQTYLKEEQSRLSKEVETIIQGDTYNGQGTNESH